MKSKILTLFLVLLMATVHRLPAQQEITVLDSTSDGTIKFALVNSKSKLAKQETPKAFLKRILNAGKGTEFYLYRVITDELGMTHEKFQQTFNGVKVEYGEFIVHKDKSGSIVSINGDFAHIPESFNLKPKLEFNDALNRAALAKKQVRYNVCDLPEERSVESPLTKRGDKYEIVIVTGYDNQLHLAYKANLTSESIFDNFYGYIDCETGDMVFAQPLVYSTNVPGTAATMYSGIRTITSDSYSGTYRLREVSRGGTTTAIQTLNFKGAPSYYTADIDNGIANATDFSDNDNNWTSAEYDNANRDNVALDAHWGAEKTFDYFKAVHSRNSYDDQNGVIKSYVHVNTRDNYGNVIAMDNGFWADSKKALFLGDGQYFSPFVCLDLVAHEIGHGICNSSVANGAGLTYSGESGALCESLSDIWGACTEQWATTTKQTWVMGEELTWGGFRSMANPKDYLQPNTYLSTNNYWVNTAGCSPNKDNDYCYVHTNSGVGNYWFYLLSQGGSGVNDIDNAYSVTGIGITKATSIVYMMETSYLLANSGYPAARNASILAATYLFGANSCETMAVTNAWYAVGVGAKFQYTNVNVSGPTLVCSSGSAFTVNNLPSGCTVSWNASSNLYSSSPTGSPAIFKAVGSGLGQVQATLSSTCASTTLSPFYVTVGSPVPGPIAIEFDAPPKRFTATIDGVGTATAYKWYLDGVLKYTTPNTSVIFQRQLDNCGHVYYVDVAEVNACGVSGISHGEVAEDPCYYGFTIFPNPASDNVTLTIGSADNASSTGNGSTGRTALASKYISTKAYTIRVSDSFGALKAMLNRSGETVTLPVGNLNNGVYVVEINDGKNVYRQQLVVKH